MIQVENYFSCKTDITIYITVIYITIYITVIYITYNIYIIYISEVKFVGQGR